jgi:hypothetical protein
MNLIPDLSSLKEVIVYSREPRAKTLILPKLQLGVTIGLSFEEPF